MQYNSRNMRFISISKQRTVARLILGHLMETHFSYITMCWRTKQHTDYFERSFGGSVSSRDGLDGGVYEFFITLRYSLNAGVTVRFKTGALGV